MDYSLIQTADQNLEYYGIYYTETELIDRTDLLAAVRQSYFQAGKRQKNRSSIQMYGETYRCAYTMEAGRVLKWKKMIGARLAERTEPTPDGYVVVTLDADKKPVKKIRFSLKHHWLSTMYYAPDRKTVAFTLCPADDGNKPVIVMNWENGTKEVLYPFEQAFDKEITESLNRIAGEPRIYARTSSGSYYFCTLSETASRENALKTLLAAETRQQQETETVEPSFQVDAAALKESTSTLTAEEQPEQPVPVQRPEAASPEEAPAPEPAETEPAACAAESSQPTEPTAPEPQPEVGIPTVLSGETGDSSILPDLSAESFSEATPETIPTQAPCPLTDACPYANVGKLIIEASGKQYYYLGEVSGEVRHGQGRTVMSDGKTAYEGTYRNDERDGFGSYYFRSGKLCYTGGWKQNRRNGLGVAFSPLDGSAFIGKWQDDSADGIGASFDNNGALVYLGKTVNGKRNGTGVTYSPEKDTFFVGKYKDGEFTGSGTQFDSDGNMLYVGGYRAGVRTGTGTSYRPDGSVLYTGEWKNNLYHGQGKLSLPEGGTLSGTFKNGKADGKCTLTDDSGRVIYVGSFANDMYNGSGRLFSDHGGYAEGRFVDGEPTGVFNEYNAQGQLIYCGEWNDMRPNGSGIAYEDGQKRYEGGFKNSRYDGCGKLYDGDSLIYAGTFRNGVRHGCGIAYEHEDILYYGMWENDLYQGCGILYEDGLPKYAGMFDHGKRQGRINEIDSGMVIRQCTYESDQPVYVCEYSAQGQLLYFGHVRDNQRSGMGCAFNENGEKLFEGIFRNGEPERPMQVFYQEQEPLPPCEALSESEYDSFRFAPEYAIARPMNSGIYTGQLKDGKPGGRGTMMFADHRYMGHFTEGEPSGEGVIYLPDGGTVRGQFNAENSSGKEYRFADRVYYVTETDTENGE